MGDVSAEPSMEDILSSIKRIIAEDGDAGQAGRPRRARPASPAPFPQEAESDDPVGVLELSDIAPAADADNDAGPATEPGPAPASEPSAVVEPIVSRDALASSRGSLDALTRMIAKPEPDAPPAEGERSMQAFVADLLRPMLREWLDAHLPDMVEALVAKEIARIAGNR